MKKQKSENRGHISFSELKIWNECPYKHKLVYLDKIKQFKGNEHTAFGTAMHHVCENVVVDHDADLLHAFNSKFLEELALLKEKKIELNRKLIEDMRVQGKSMLTSILPGLKDCFEDYEVISVEEDLMEPLDDVLHFKGFIDLVIKVGETYHIIDWKTCSWGWDTKRKADRMTTYQLTLYKNFFAKKHNIEPKDIETHFALLKRTAKKDRVEIFRVTSGPKKTENALKLLSMAVYNIKKRNFVKNLASCTGGYGCEFYNTKFCTR